MENKDIFEKMLSSLIQEIEEKKETNQEDERTLKWGKIGLEILNQSFEEKNLDDNSKSKKNTTNISKENNINSEEDPTVKQKLSNSLLLSEMKENTRSLLLKSKSFESKLKDDQIIDEITRSYEKGNRGLKEENEPEMGVGWYFWISFVGFILGYCVIRIL